MSVKVVVLPDTTEELSCLGFAVNLDSEVDQLDAVYRALKSIPNARVEYLDSKRFRADLPVRSGQGNISSVV